VNFSSVMAKEVDGSPGYIVSKSGLETLTQVLGYNFRNSNIGVNCIAFGYINKGMGKRLDQENIDKYKGNAMKNRLSKMDELVRVVKMLTIHEPCYTGTTIDLTGVLIYG